MCGGFFRYLITLITPSPSEVKGAMVVVALGIVGVGYAFYKGIHSSRMSYRTYEGEVVEPKREKPPVDTTYFLYERRVYLQRRSRPHPVNINRAGISELVDLPGIGPKLAKRIVEHRKKFGPYRRPEDLLDVKGIGPKKLKKIEPYLRF